MQVNENCKFDVSRWDNSTLWVIAESGKNKCSALVSESARVDLSSVQVNGKSVDLMNYTSNGYLKMKIEIEKFLRGEK